MIGMPRGRKALPRPDPSWRVSHGGAHLQEAVELLLGLGEALAVHAVHEVRHRVHLVANMVFGSIVCTYAKTGF